MQQSTLRIILQAVVVAVFTSMASAQAPVEPTGLDAAHLSPTLYFSSSSEELFSRNALHAKIEPLVKQLAATPPASLLQVLGTADQTLIALQRHAAYLRVQALEDTQDQGAKNSGAMVNTDRSALEAAMRSRLRQVSPNEVAGLGRFAYLAEQAQQDAKHDLSPDGEQYRGLVVPPFENSISSAYDRLIDSLDDSSGKGAASPDFSIRRAAIASREEAYDRAAPMTAALLGSLIDIENRDAAAEGYANAADRKYSSLSLSTGQIDQTLASVQAEAPAYRHYQEVLAQHAAKKLKLPSILSDELSFAYETPPRIPLSQARQLILDSFQPLGSDYIQRFGRLLDPANGRLDLSGGAHRARAGTSISAYDAPVAFYFSGYNGSLRSVSTIAHEGGHAIHRELMNSSGMPVYERTGPHYLSEGFAIFNELLLLDHAVQIAKTPEEREYALERLLWKVSTELFMSAEETVFERDLYTQASGQALLDRAAVDRIYRGSIAPYEYWPVSDVGSSRGWMRKSLLFEDPLYLVNYLYAAVVAVALYERSHTDPDFAAKYEALLKRGFNAPAQELLLSMNIRLDDPNLVKAAARLFETRTDELNRLYQAEPVR